MNSFCNDKFWNTNLTWHSAYPDFTDCFQETVLSWIPCIFLWIFAPIEIYYVKSDKINRILRNSRNMMKYVILSLLIGIKFVDLIYEVNSAPVYVVNPVIKMATFLLAMVQLRFQLRYGIQSSGVSFIFSTLLMICYIPQVKSAFNPAIPDYYKIISACLYFILAVGLFLLNCFADEMPAGHKLFYSDKMCPVKTASFLNKLFFHWLDPLILSGYRKALEENDMYDTIPEYKCANVTPKFEKYSTILKLIFRQNTGLIILSALIRILFDVFTLLSPFLLRLLISYSIGVEESWKGYLYTVALFLIAVSISVLHGQSMYYAYLAGFKIRSAMVAAIYKKSLQMTNMSIQDSTLGQIVNLMSVDAQTVFMVIPQINSLWSAPFTIVITFYFLWGIIGISSLAGLIVMILIVPINGVISTFLQKNQMSNMKKKDERVKFVSEILNGIKVLKLYAWEPSFEKLTDGIRKLELKFLKNKGYLMAGIFFTFYIAPFLMSLASFATYVLIDSEHVLTAEIAFVSIAFFNILKMPLAMFPLVLSQSLQAWVSIKRINKFLNRPEFKPDNVTHEKMDKDIVLIENGTFSWGIEEAFQLKNLNLRIQQKKLIAVVGPVGCGKSSLISAILGETLKLNGQVNVSGTVAYVPQIPWILNTTIKENILFGADFNKAFYEKVLHACSLNADLEILPGGDQTEIGEKGVNLSGGQKQRVSLARAVYANPDLILFDDPLSAVDAHVGKHIFDNVIGPNGLFKMKTRLFITHNITFLQQTDEIIVMKNGEIWENGTYQELMALDGTFATLITDYSNQKQGVSTTVETAPDTPVSTKPEAKIKKIASDPKKLIEKEMAATGNVNWPIYFKYFNFVGLPLIAAIIFFYITAQIFTVLTSALLIFWSEDHNTNDSSIQNMYLLSYSGLGIGQAILVYIGTALIVIGSARASKSMHGNLLSAILHLPMSFFDSTPIGRILNRFSKDIDIIDGLLPDSMRGALLILLNVAGILIVIAVITPWFIVVVIPFTASYYFIQKYYIATLRQVNRIESTARSPIYSHFGETVAGRSSIRAYNVESRFIKKSQDLIDFHMSCNYSNVMCTLWLGVRLESLGSFILFFASIFTVLSRGEISPGSVGLSLNYALMITSNLCYLVYMISEVESYVVAIERLDEYINLPQEAAYNKPIKNQYWPESGAIEFQSFKVRYRDGLDLVLKDVSFKVQPNQRIGIVGRTGAGKSSITLSLFRIIEAAAGKILIDDVDISTLGLQEIRSKITIIPQDPVLFSGTLRWNIDPFEAYNDQEIWTALEHAHLKSYVSNLPDGLWYTIAEGGENISVGQRQLICLARALLRKTKVLILDEATAAVDLETDEIIQETIRREFKNCTILTIAHRLNTIMDSDKIVVLSNGTIVEYDSPANLLKNPNGMFYGMATESGLV